MRILLKDDNTNSNATLDFDLDPIPNAWRDQNPAARHRIINKTGQQRPFHQVFLKRWNNREAPAHELLTTICGKTLPGTPTVFGIGRTGKDVIYTTEFMAEHDTLNNRLKQGGDIADIITPNLLHQIISAATGCFEALEQYKHVYTDFGIMNMLHGPNDGIMLIDLDSAWPIQQLVTHWNDPLIVDNFDRRFWLLWSQYIVKKLDAGSAATVANKSMIFSFAAMYGKALGLLNLPNPPADHEILELVRQPSADDQNEIWHTLEHGDEITFYQRLNIAAPTQNLFAEWHDIFQWLTAGLEVGWDDIRNATNDLAACYPQQIKQVQVKPATPTTKRQKKLALKSQMANVGKVILIGAIDPFGLLRKSGVVKRGPFGS